MKNLKILLVLMIFVCCHSTFGFAQTKSSIEKFLHEELTTEEFNLMKKIKSSTKLDYPKIFTGYIEPMREDMENKGDGSPPVIVERKKAIKGSTPNNGEIPLIKKEIVDDSDARPISVKGADTKLRAAELKAERAKSEEDVGSKGAKSKDQSKESIREKLKKAQYEGKVKKRRAVIDRKQEVVRNPGRRKKVQDSRRTKKKNRFGTKYIHVDDDGEPLDERDDGFYSEGFKEKTFGSKRVENSKSKGASSDGFESFAETQGPKEKTFRKQRKRKKLFGKEGRKKIFNRSDSK